MRFKERVVLVVGASGDIGQRLCHSFLENGAKVFGTFNFLDKDIPNNVVKIRMNVRDNFEVQRALECIEKIDVVIYAAGLTDNAKIAEMRLGSWNQVLSVNLTGVFSVIKYVIPKMSDGGHIILLGSVVAETGGYGCANYAASKAGLRGLCKASSNELLKKKIYINLLELGYFETGMGLEFTPEIKDKICKTIPLGHFGDPEEIVNAVFFLSETKYMTGNTLKIAGGL